MADALPLIIFIAFPITLVWACQGDPL